MPEEEKGTHLHHPEGPTPGEIIGVEEKGKRRFATLKEFRKSLEGAGAEVRKKANKLREQLRIALAEDDKRKAIKTLEGVDELVDEEPKLERWSELMEQEATGKAPPGESYLEQKERRKAPPPEERPADRKPEDIRRISDEIDQEKDKEGVLFDPRTEKMKYIEGRYFLWVEEPRRTIEEVEEQYLTYLAGIGARQPTPGQGIAGREWEEIARYTAEVDAIIRTTEDNEVKEKAQYLKQFAQAYYHELEYYHRFYYGETEGIGKEVYRPKEGSRLLLIDQLGPLWAHPEVAKLLKKEKGYKSDAELIAEEKHPYGFGRLAHHLARYGLYPMRGDAYEEGVRINKIVYEKRWKERVFSVDDWGRQLKRTIGEIEGAVEKRALTEEQKTNLEAAEWEDFQAEQRFRQRLTDVLRHELPPKLTSPEEIRPISYQISQGLEAALNALYFDERGRPIELSERGREARLTAALSLLLQDLPLLREQRDRVRSAILEQTKEEREALRGRKHAYREMLKAVLSGFEDLTEEEERLRQELLTDSPIKTIRFVIYDPGFGKSFEYSLYGVYYTTSWAKETKPKAWELLIITDADGRPVMDLGEMGATYDMWTSPARLRLYLLNWEYIDERNRIRLTAGRDWLMANPETFLPKEESEGLRDLLWKARDGEKLTRAEEAKLAATFSEAEIKALQESLQKIIRGEGLTPEEKEKMDEFLSVASRNILNRDLGIDPKELNYEEIWREGSQSYHERITPNDILTNILVEVRRMEQTKNDLISGDEALLAKPSFEKAFSLEAQRYAHLGDIPWIKEGQISQLREIVTRIFLAGVISEIRYSGSALFEEKRKEIYDTLKANTSVGFHAAELKGLYGIDFTDPNLRERGAPLPLVIDKLIQVHGEGNLRRIYIDRGEQWVINVLNNREEASEIDKSRFLNRFGFNSYTLFEVGIIEEPVLNAGGVTRRRLGEMTDRQRTRLLWLAKKGILPEDQGIWMESRDQRLRAGWERWGDSRREGGTWIEGRQPETEEWEKVGYMIEEVGKEVFWRRITSEDPIQNDLFWVEQMIYSRNSELISAHLSNQSARIKENPNEWLTPPERRVLIDKHRSVLDIDDGRAVELMRIHGCRDGDVWLWTAKSWLFTYALEPLARALPGVQQFQTGRRVPANLAGLTVSGGVGLWTFTQWAAAGPLAAGPLSMVASAVALIPASWALRRLTRVREIPLLHWTEIGPDIRIGPFGIGPNVRIRQFRISPQLRLPLFWLREGKEPPSLE